MAKLKSGTRIYGTSTIDTSVVVGSAVTANSSGIQVTGVVTATSFRGDGSQLTGVPASYATIAGIATNVRGTANRILYNSATDTTTTSSNLTFDGTNASIAGVITANAYRSNFANNIFVGNGAGIAVTTIAGGGGNSFGNLIGLGVNCLSNVYENAQGGSNTFAPQVAIGQGCLQSLTINTGGGGRFYATNVAIGYECGRSTTAGGSPANLNVLVGYQVAYVNDFGSAAYNNIFGTQSGYNLSSGTGNSLFGYQAGYNVTTGGYNVFNGYFSGYSNASGSYNIGIGYSAGRINLTGSRNIVIGYNRDVPISAGNDQLVIGSNTSDWIVGNSSYNVGLGTTNPSQKLHVQGNVRITDGLYDSNNNVGTAGSVLSSTGSGLSWIAAGSGGGSSLSISTSVVSQSQYLSFVSSASTSILGISTVSQPLVFTPSTGNLGIGTTIPLQKAHILGSLLVAAGSSTGQHITQKAYELNSGTLSWEGTAGQLFSITNNLTSGSIFSVNDVSGIPSIDVNANGTVSMAAYGGLVGIGVTNPPYRFTVVGSGATATPSLTNVIADFTGNVNGYSQINTRNASSGANASSDIIATADTGTDSTNYIDLGIHNSGYSVAGWTINGALDGYLYTSNSNLSIGAASANKYVSIFTGGTLAANEGLRVNSTGVGIGTTNPTQNLHVRGNVRVTGAVYDSTNSPGTSGQVLQSTVTGTQWAAAAGGSAGGSGKFDTTIDNVLYVQPTGTLDIVGVGTTTTQITTLPSGSNKYIIHSMHVTNVSNGDAEVTAGFVMNARKVSASISVSIGSSGGAGINTFSVGSASGITVGMAVTGTGNIGETTGIGSTSGFQYNTYVTSVDGTSITLSKPMSGYATGTLFFSPVSKVASRLPVPVGSAVELLKQPMVLNALDSIVLQSTGAGSGIGSTSTAAISQTANSNILTVTAGAAITNYITSGMLIAPTGSNTGIQTNTFVGVGYTPGSLSVPMTRPATSTLSSQILSFTEVILPQDGALQTTIVYQSSTDTSYLNGTGIVTTSPSVYYSTGSTYPSIVQSIRVTNISDGAIYPGGDYPVSVGIGNSDTVFSWLAYNMVIPKNSSIELCEAPKRIGLGQSIFASSPISGVIEIQVAGKQKTS